MATKKTRNRAALREELNASEFARIGRKRNKTWEEERSARRLRAQKAEARRARRMRCHE